MRLKTLFFPIVLVISFFIGFGYVWPEAMKIKDMNEKKIEKQKTLENIEAKKRLILQAKEKMSSGDLGVFVKDYLPERRIEEKIISNISYLASDSNISLLDISMTDSGKSQSKPAVAESNATTISGMGSGIKNIDPVMESIPVKVSVSGTFQQTKVFLDGLQRLPIFNNVDSLSISKKATEKKSDENDSPAGEDSLLVDAVINFGYMGVSKISESEASSLSLNIDEETIKGLKGYVSTKEQILSPALAGEKGGRTNPFLVN
ncbi:MAG: hypothetical protein ACD_8C00143G0013 [uncultured bacterium]|nr:MAG: hypothetical protein ACD_8C00143G0013 [uncultured bacterium]